MFKVQTFISQLKMFLPLYTSTASRFMYFYTALNAVVVGTCIKYKHLKQSFDSSEENDSNQIKILNNLN